MPCSRVQCSTELGCWQKHRLGAACGRHRSPGNGLISFFPRARLPRASLPTTCLSLPSILPSICLELAQHLAYHLPRACLAFCLLLTLSACLSWPTLSWSRVGIMFNNIIMFGHSISQNQLVFRDVERKITSIR